MIGLTARYLNDSQEAQQLQQKANEALKSASEAERDFRRLETDCQALMNQLLAERRDQRAMNDAVCLSPMTPRPPGAAPISDEDNPFGWPSRVAPTFDFTALFAKSPEAGAPRIKSSIRNSDAAKASAAKSISFGPITTFVASGSPGDESDEPLSPVATSTLTRQSTSVSNNHARSASLLAS